MKCLKNVFFFYYYSVSNSLHFVHLDINITANGIITSEKLTMFVHK